MDVIADLVYRFAHIHIQLQFNYYKKIFCWFSWIFRIVQQVGNLQFAIMNHFNAETKQRHVIYFKFPNLYGLFSSLHKSIFNINTLQVILRISKYKNNQHLRKNFYKYNCYWRILSNLIWLIVPFSFLSSFSFLICHIF